MFYASDRAPDPGAQAGEDRLDHILYSFPIAKSIDILVLQGYQIPLAAAISMSMQFSHAMNPDPYISVSHIDNAEGAFVSEIRVVHVHLLTMTRSHRSGLVSLFYLFPLAYRIS